MTETLNYTNKFLFGVLVGMALIASITTYVGHKWDSEIVKQGCAEYNSSTGEFQWKEIR